MGRVGKLGGAQESAGKNNASIPIEIKIKFTNKDEINLIHKIVKMVHKCL